MECFAEVFTLNGLKTFSVLQACVELFRGHIITSFCRNVRTVYFDHLEAVARCGF